MSFLEQLLLDCTLLIEEISIKTGIKLLKPEFSSYPEILTYLDELNKLYPNFRYCSKNSKISDYVVMEGFILISDNVEILPFTHIRGPVIINSKSKVKGEIKRSYIGKHTNSAHMSNYIGDSIIGDNCNFGAGTKTANLRFDGKNIIFREGDKKINTGMRKFGCIMENNVKTAINSVIMPGNYIESGSRIIN